MLDDPRQHDLIRRLWLDGPLSRTELHQRLKITPNGVGSLAEALIDKGILRECTPEASKGGRPRIPLDIDPSARHVIGLSLAPGRVEAARYGLRGQALGSLITERVEQPAKMIPTARRVLKKLKNDQTFAIGMSVPGFIDASSRAILFSSATRGLGRQSLQPLFDEAGDIPLVVENDMHAAGARWMLTHRSNESEDVVLIGFEDGEMGATMILKGRSNQGCVNSANEFGHMRFLVDTERCFCGHTGCLERIFSSDFLRRKSGSAGEVSLGERIRRFDEADGALREIVQYLAMGIANITNFVRPHQLVLASHATRSADFSESLVRSLRGLLFVELADRVRISLWDQAATSSADSAAWLALAGLFSAGWSSHPAFQRGHVSRRADRGAAPAGI